MKYHKIKRLFLFTLVTLTMVFFNINAVIAAKLAPNDAITATAQIATKLPVYLFWGDGCPHCHAEILFLEKIKGNYPTIEFNDFEVYNSKDNYNLLVKMLAQQGQKVTGVPVTIIGDQVIVGYGNDEISGARIQQTLDIYVAKNKVQGHNTGMTVAQVQKSVDPSLAKTVKYPIIGKINLTNLSLPILTAVLGILDGFNPCSMWALIILISLLLNTGSRKKMWVIGGTFIITSAISYFLFLTAWFNALKFVGYLPIVKISLGVLAVGVGFYFLQDYIKKRKQQGLTCEVTSAKTQNKIIKRLQTVVQEKSMLAAILGVTVVAFSVNLIELMCSAGIPAIYTSILAENHLAHGSYYGYLLIYDFFYMLDDMVVLLIAGTTWQMLQNTGKYTKYSHLIGGILLLILGVIMLVNPNLLMVK